MAYVKVLSERLDQYKLVEDSYTGDGGFVNGEYLVRYRREQDIQERYELASYSNYVQPIVNSMVDPVFSKKPQREFSSDIIDVFLKDATNSGIPLQAIIHETVRMGTLMGNHFIIMDNFKDDEIPTTRSEVIKGRWLPYVFTKSVAEVYEYETDIYGNPIYITFRIGYSNEENYDEQKELYRRYTNNEIQYLEGKDGNLNITARVQHKLGVMPVVMFDKKDIAPFPPFYSLATQAKKIFNVQSEINDLERSQNFSILLMPSLNPASEKKQGIVLGSSKALFYNSENKLAPNYISPDSKIMETSLKYLQNITDTLIQSADVLGSTATQRTSKAESGTALSYKFYGKQQALLNSSHKANMLEQEVMKLFFAFVGDTSDYSVLYHSRFNPTDDEIALRLQSIQSVLKLDISDEVRMQLCKDVLNMLASQNGWTDEVLNVMMNSLTPESAKRILEENIPQPNTGFGVEAK